VARIQITKIKEEKYFIAIRTRNPLRDDTVQLAFRYPDLYDFDFVVIESGVVRRCAVDETFRVWRRGRGDVCMF
jgi:hypothetical protein